MKNPDHPLVERKRGHHLEPREEWRRVLDAEFRRWSAKAYDELTAELTEVRAYQVENEGKTYTVEIQLLENTDKYVHVCIDVDDGTIPASFRPMSSSFIRHKLEHQPLATHH